MRFVAAILFFFSTIAAADSYFIENAKGNGIGADDESSITELIHSSITESGKNTLAADAKNAQYVLKPKILRLGSSYVMTLDKTRDGKVIFSSQLKAARIEELDGVAARLTRAVMDEVPAKGDARIGDVTETESRDGTRRKETQKHWFIGFGPFGASNMGTSGTLYNFDIAYAWDINLFQVKIFYDGTTPGSSSQSSVTAPSGQTVNVGTLGDFGIGTNYYFKDTDTSSFVSGDFGYGGNASVSSFIGGVGAGMSFFRTSNINLELALRFAYMFNPTPLGNPSVYGLRLGIYF